MKSTVQQSKVFTYEDYQTWSDEERWEIIDGVAYDMSPAPTIRHQNIAGNFFIQLKLSSKNPCYTGIAPTDIVFDMFNVVQPDVFVVCDKNKITDKNIQGAPDLIVEVISPGTELKDRRDKKKLYERHKVREYITIFPVREYIERYLLKNDKYEGSEIINWDEVLKINLFDIEIKLWEIFEKEPIKTEEQKLG